jgi:small subunit ribosomal protein S15
MTGPAGGHKLPARRLAKILEGAIVMSLTKEKKTQLIKDYCIHEGDTGSTEVQIALMTERITQIAAHLKANGNDISSRRGLYKLVGQRRRLLTYLRGKAYNRYVALTERLSIRQK